MNFNDDIDAFRTPEPEEKKDGSVLTPFLTQHISESALPTDNYHKYCYRHNPEITRNKTVDDDKMKGLQENIDKLTSSDQQAITHVWSIFSAAPSNQRKLILQGILSQCCFPTLSYISSEVSSLIKIDFISALPMEISLKILCYLDCVSLCNAAQVSKSWKKLADDDRVWHHMCEQHIDRKCPKCGWGLPLMHMKRAREEYEANVSDEPPQNSIPPSQVTGECEPKVQEIKAEPEPKRRRLSRRPWKSVYSERYKLEKNWRKGIYKMKEFIGHTDGITCLQFNNKYLITGSYDTCIKIWDIATQTCVRTLTGHTKGIKSLVFDNQKLISCGLDSTIRVWNYHTGECISTYRGHEDAVVSVDFSDKTIISGSADSTVKVWHVDSRTCYTLRGHTGWVNSVKIHQPSQTAFSASDDTTIKMWDLNTHKCIKTFGGVENNGHVGQVQCVIPFNYKDKLYDDRGFQDSSGSESEDYEEFNEEIKNGPSHILTSSLDNTIKVWDVKTGKCIRTQFGHIEGVWSISADNFRIISGAHDRLIKVWDLQDGKCLHTVGNNSSVSCVGLSDSKFAAGLENGVVKLFCFD
ncbi:F-box protein Met30p [[Candida] jaroonii]|uniref:F-box protein Met30p n=1 Tax=[Candida] jaroonii TaxID=467808 RepID=A0ACA9Y0Q9_9ASCO|nr:F-box protein Met30p [[Candida] jaroonii]